MNKVLKTILFWFKCLEAEMMFAANKKEIEKMNNVLRKANNEKKTVK